MNVPYERRMSINIQPFALFLDTSVNIAHLGKPPLTKTDDFSENDYFTTKKSRD